MSSKEWLEFSELLRERAEQIFENRRLNRKGTERNTTVADTLLEISDCAREMGKKETTAEDLYLLYEQDKK